jgi:hypothetical protein
MEKLSYIFFTSTSECIILIILLNGILQKSFRFKVLTVVIMKTTVFWDVILCTLIDC